MSNPPALTGLNRLHADRLAGKTTTVEICRAVLKRIEEAEPKIKAFITQTPDGLMEKAEKTDEKIRQGKATGRLEGMPLAIKDILVTKGIKTTCGSRFLSNFFPPYESTVTAKLLDAGAGFVGKTNLDEFAMGSSTENSAFYPTRNPFDLERVPGGSSGGSAAAVAAGMCLGAVGTDTGGSIRQPAGFCGTVGLKPTYGRVSRYGLVAYGSSLDQAGPLARNVEDCADLLGSMSGYDPMDGTSADVPVPDYRSFLNQDVRGLKIGVLSNVDLDDCESDVRDNFQASLGEFEKGGAEIREVELDHLEHGVATYYILATSEASSNLSKFDGVRYGVRADAENLESLYSRSRNEGFGDEVKLRIMIGTFSLSSGYYDAYYSKAQKVRNLLRHNFVELFRQVDLIAMPVAPTTAFKMGAHVDNPLKMYLGDVFTVPANLAGIPGISFPAGIDGDGMPIGFQLLATHFAEGTLIRAAHWFERNVPVTTPTLRA